MDIFETRRRNLLALIQEKYEGNRSEFARKTGQSPNVINLSLTINNKQRRNIGEKLARSIEEGSSLPVGWLDEDRSRQKSGLQIVREIPRFPGDKPVMECPFPDHLVVGEEWLKNLVGEVELDDIRAFHIKDQAMSGVINPGEVALIDTSRKVAKEDGLYLLLMPSGESTVRQIFNDIDGSVTVKAANPSYPSKVMTKKDVSHLKVKGRLIARLLGMAF